MCCPLSAAGTQPAAELADVPPGRYRLLAERPGYLKTYYGAGSIITLRAGAPISGLAIRMTEQAVISGKVTLGEDAASTVMVYLFQQKYQNGAQEWVRITSVVGEPGGDSASTRLRPADTGLAPRLVSFKGRPASGPRDMS